MTKNAQLQQTTSEKPNSMPSMPLRNLSDRQKSDGEAFLRTFPSEQSVLAYFAPVKWSAALANADKAPAFSEMTLRLLDTTYSEGLAARIIDNNIRGLYALGRPYEPVNIMAVNQTAALFVGKYGTELSVFGTLLYFAQYLTNHKGTNGQFDLVDVLRQCERSFLPQWRKRLAKKENESKVKKQCRETGVPALYTYLRGEYVAKGIDIRTAPIVQLCSFDEKTLRFIESGEPLPL